MGPIDYIVLEWPGRSRPVRRAAPDPDLVDRGLIRILDVAFLGKDEDGSVAALDIADLDADEAFGVFEGASSGPAARGGPRGGRVGARARHLGGRARLGEPLGGPGRRRASASRAVSWSPAAASPSRPSSRRSTRSRAPTESREEPNARTASRGGPHRRRRRDGDRRQQPRLAPPGLALVAAGPPQQGYAPGAAASAAAAAAPAPDPIAQLKQLGR